MEWTIWPGLWRHISQTGAWVRFGLPLATPAPPDNTHVAHSWAHRWYEWCERTYFGLIPKIFATVLPNPSRSPNQLGKHDNREKTLWCNATNKSIFCQMLRIHCLQYAQRHTDWTLAVPRLVFINWLKQHGSGVGGNDEVKKEKGFFYTCLRVFCLCGKKNVYV